MDAAEKGLFIPPQAMLDLQDHLSDYKFPHLQKGQSSSEPPGARCKQTCPLHPGDAGRKLRFSVPRVLQWLWGS